MKRWTLLLVLAAAVAGAQDKKISELTDGSPGQATDSIPIARGGVNYRLPFTAFGAAFSGGIITNPIIGPETQDATGNTVQQQSLDAALGVNSIGFYDVTFTGVKDPIMWWGYNRAGGPANHPRLYWQVEGFYHNGPGGHDWSETYVNRVDTNGVSYRPFGIGTYDGYAEASFYTDNFYVNKFDGTLQLAVGSGAVQVGAAANLIIQGNNHIGIKGTLSGGGYVGLIYLDANDRIKIGEGARDSYTDGKFGPGRWNPAYHLDVGSTGARIGGTGQLLLYDEGAKPACDAAGRGRIWYDAGAAGVKDTVEVCAKDAGDAYAWRPIY